MGNTYRGVTVDKNGIRRYMYECRICGENVPYRQKHRSDFPAICNNCKKRSNNKQEELEKQKEHDNNLVLETIDTCIDGMKTSIESIKTPWLTRKQINKVLDDLYLQLTSQKTEEHLESQTDEKGKENE